MWKTNMRRVKCRSNYVAASAGCHSNVTREIAKHKCAEAAVCCRGCDLNEIFKKKEEILWYQCMKRLSTMYSLYRPGEHLFGASYVQENIVCCPCALEISCLLCVKVKGQTECLHDINELLDLYSITVFSTRESIRLRYLYLFTGCFDSLHGSHRKLCPGGVRTDWRCGLHSHLHVLRGVTAAWVVILWDATQSGTRCSQRF